MEMVTLAWRGSSGHFTLGLVAQPRGSCRPKCVTKPGYLPTYSHQGQDKLCLSELLVPPGKLAFPSCVNKVRPFIKLASMT